MAARFVRSVCRAGAVLMLVGPWSMRAQAVAVADPLSTASVSRVTLDVANASLSRVIEAIAKQAGLRPVWDEKTLDLSARVSVRVQGRPATEAFAIALQGTGLRAKVLGKNVAIVREVESAAVVQGEIVGKVLDAKTRQGIRGATVMLGGANRRTTTADDGGFRLSSVAPGTYTVQVRLLGYLRADKTVTVVESQTASMEVVLEPSVSTLDQVVVTGTVIPTELKAVPNAMTVITAKQIEERGITKIDQLFRGDVPGLFAQNQGSSPNALLDEVTMYSRGTTSLSVSDIVVGGTTAYTNPIKTYVDGVEMADPKYLSQIDPKSIERIEIVTGPQASTIYGSNAINGVMQIFTKRGKTSSPQLTLNLQSGWVENNFTSARTPQHDYALQLNGMEGRLSYNAGGSWQYMGPWTPAKQTARTSAFGGTRLDLPTAVGRVTADATLRRSVTTNRQRGTESQVWTAYREAGWYVNLNSSIGVSAPRAYELTGLTLGLSLGYVPTSWWSHEFVLGQDATDIENRVTARGFTTTSDTTLFLRRNTTERRSLRYTTTAQIPMASLATATVTMGADAWQNLETSSSVSPQVLTGSLTGSTSMARQPGHNAGGFLQTQVGVQDRLYFTYGLRAEWNPNYGEDAQPNYAPRYGIAYTQEFGVLTTKLRWSYGRATRPPRPKISALYTITDNYADFGLGPPMAIIADYGNYPVRLANPDLGPETQQGGEGGVELYWGSRGSLVVTRYNQTVDGVIAYVKVDSARSFVPNPPSGSWNSQDVDGYGYVYERQYLNVGNIRNQGWEIQGSINLGPVTTRGTYSWTKSRTIGVDPRYRALFSPASSFPQYQPGATFQYFPEHTWAAGVTYAHASTTIAVNMTGNGQTRFFQNELFYRSLSGDVRLPNDRLRFDGGAAYRGVNRGYALTDLIVTQRMSSRVEGVAQVQNLTDYYANDFQGNFATMGRQVKAGLRAKF